MDERSKEDGGARPPRRDGGREPTRTGLPAPRIVFGADFLPRLERCTARLSGVVQRREGAGAARAAGGGEEFVGYRPYRAGEDLRNLDWNLLGRLDRPFVRVARREAHERWRVLLDRSGSMGVGPPGKLQRAAEVAVALACLGARAGARVVLDAEGLEELDAGRGGGWTRWMAKLEGLRAAGRSGLAGPLARAARSDAGRVFLLGDLLDLEPRALAGLARPGREVQVAQLLAPVELLPDTEQGADGAWIHVRDPELPELPDPEAREPGGGSAGQPGDGRWVRFDTAELRAYESALEERLDRWRAAAVRHRFGHVVASSATPFEDLLRELAGA